jgi:ribosomal protein L7/L12
MSNLNNIVESILALNALELVELKEQLMKVFKLDSSNLGSSNQKEAGAPEEVAAKLFSAQLAGIGETPRTEAMKFLRSRYSLSISDAKSWIDHLPRIIQENLIPADGNALVAEFKAAGLIVELV